MEGMKRGPKPKPWAIKKHSFPNVSITGSVIEWATAASQETNTKISHITEKALRIYLEQNFPELKKK